MDLCSLEHVCCCSLMMHRFLNARMDSGRLMAAVEETGSCQNHPRMDWLVQEHAAGEQTPVAWQKPENP